MYFAKLMCCDDVAAFQTEEERDRWVSADCDRLPYSDDDEPYYQRMSISEKQAKTLTGKSDFSNVKLVPDPVFGTCSWIA